MNALSLLIAITVGQSNPTGFQDGILGIKIGSALSEARAILSPLGEGGGKDTHDKGRREAWSLRDSPFKTVTFQSTGKGKVKWVSGYLRDGSEIPFRALGDPKKATAFGDDEAIWNVPTDAGGYRLVAKGAGRKAKVVYLLSTAVSIR